MHHFIKPLILSCCVVLGAGISVTLVRGQVPAKRNLQDKKATANTAPAPSVVLDAPPMRTPEPGSPEAERMAAFQARVKAGLVPTVHIGIPPQQKPYKRPTRMPDFVATQVVPQKGVSGEMLAFQQKLDAAFAAADPIPPSRVNHFAWLKNHPNVRIYGWYGTVTWSQVQADSSVIVNVEFHPKTEITGQRGFVRDFATEKYQVANGQLHLIDTDADINNPAIQVISPL
jgi:hypothetical protein